MTTIRRWASDESLWLTAGALVAAVLSSVPGLAGLAVPVKAAIDGSAGAIAAVFVGGVAHRKATATAAAAKSGASTGASPEAFGTLVADFARQVDALVKG